MKKNEVLQVVSRRGFAIGVLSVCCTLAALYPNMSYDEIIWSYIGQSWNDFGVPPYTGVVENKTPGIFYLYAVLDHLAPYHIIITRALGIIATVITAVLLGRIAEHLYNPKSGVLVLYIFGLASCWFVVDGYAFAMTEVFMVLFTVLGLYVLLGLSPVKQGNRVLFITGLCVGFAILFKQIAVTSMAALTILFLYLNHKSPIGNLVKGVVVLTGGVLAASFTGYAVLFFSGVSFGEIIDGAWGILLNSGSSAGDLATRASNAVSVLILSRMMLFWLAIGVLVYRRQSIGKQVVGVLSIWLIFEFIGANASGYYYGHQLRQVLPVLSLIAGIVLYQLFISTSNKSAISGNTGFAIVLLVLMFFPYKQVAFNTYSFYKQSPGIGLEAGQWLNENSSASDYVYALGGDIKIMKALLRSERRSSSAYINAMFVTSEDERSHVLNNLQETPPLYIFYLKEFDSGLESVYGPEVKDLIMSQYVLVKRIEGIEIFKKSGSKTSNF